MICISEETFFRLRRNLNDFFFVSELDFVKRRSHHTLLKKAFSKIHFLGRTYENDFYAFTAHLGSLARILHAHEVNTMT